MVVDGIVAPMELGHLPYRRHTFEDYVGVGGRERLGQKKWEQAVRDVIARLIAALEPEEVVLGGGNVKNLKKLPPSCRTGDNANAFVGGFRLWQKTKRRNTSMRQKASIGTNEGHNEPESLLGSYERNPGIAMHD
jgi:polyphosphate glucokinase